MGLALIPNYMIMLDNCRCMPKKEVVFMHGNDRFAQKGVLVVDNQGTARAVREFRLDE